MELLRVSGAAPCAADGVSRRPVGPPKGNDGRLANDVKMRETPPGDYHNKVVLSAPERSPESGVRRRSQAAGLPHPSQSSLVNVQTPEARQASPTPDL
jgi:hypothetical protein